MKTRAAGFSGTAAILWGGDVPTTIAKLDAGGLSDDILHNFKTTAAEVT